VKKILFIVLIVSGNFCFSQTNLDTVYVRYLTLKSKDWAYIASYLDSEPKDSFAYNRMRKLRAQILAVNPATWNTDVTIDSLPGKWVVKIYEIIRSISIGEYEQVGTNIKTAIAAKAQVSTWIAEIDSVFSDMYIERRTRGKYILLDN